MLTSHRLPRFLRVFGVVLITVSLLACGGSDDDGPAGQPTPPVEEGPGTPPGPNPEPPAPDEPGAPEPEPEPVPTPARGDLVSATVLIDIGPEAINDALASGESKVTGLQALHPVRPVRLTYRTTDKDGELVVASGLVVVPQRPSQAASPVISYQHATTFVNANAPSLRMEPGEPPMVLASLGYIVVAADYVGFAQTQGLDHPYLQAEPSARAVIDLLVAARTWRQQAGVLDSGQLYLVGYSEGGYATMAAQRAMTLTQHPLLTQLVASLPAAGPYDVQTTLDSQLARVRDEYPALAWMLSPGTLRHLGGTVRREVRRALLRLMIPGEADVSYQAKFLDDYMADDQQAIRQDSSVHWGWSPTAPVYLFHGRDDQTVPYGASTAALAELQAAGGAPVSLQDCTEPDSGHLQCVSQYFLYATSVMAQTSRQ